MGVKLALIALALLPASLLAQQRGERWMVILKSPPLVEKIAAREQLRSATSAAIVSEQSQAMREIESLGAEITGSNSLLVNAVYFRGTEAEAARLRGLPEVLEVVREQRYRRRADDGALELTKAQQAWPAVGGEGNAGAGVRIAIVDSGIDPTHPALDDQSLTPPTGFPRVTRESDRVFTSNKVIVARSYVESLILGDTPADSRPDDISARDRVGHGTGIAMLAAGRRVIGPAATVGGVAPKAFLGSYKVFGSPGVNDNAFTSTVITALEDAVRDGMEIATLSLARTTSSPALAICSDNRPCDRLATAVHLASRAGMLVVTPAGNSGDFGFTFPVLGSIETPGTAPAALTVGAFTNRHAYYQSVRVNAGPSNLQRINGQFGDGPVPDQPLTRPVKDVATLGDDGKACRPLGNGVLNASIAIIERGDCTRELKVIYAQRAGAEAVILTQPDSNGIFPPEGLTGTGIPLVLIGRDNAQALRSYLQSTPFATVTLDPAFAQVDAPPNEIGYFSSQGPTLGEFAIKPEITAVGTDLYMATQNFDPNSGLYDKNRFRAFQGTSYAVPLAAGAAALVKQRNPTWTAPMVKSAIVNTADPNVDDFDVNGRRFRAGVNGTGAGKLDAAQALTTTITADPATLAFATINAPPVSRGLVLTNTTNASVTLRIEVQQRDQDSNARITVAPSTFSIPPLQQTQVTVRLEGLRPNPGSYEGVLTIAGSGTTLRVPYLYLVGDGVAANVYPTLSDGFVAVAGTELPIDSRPLIGRVVDRYGVPVANQPVRWRVLSGGGSIVSPETSTDSFGLVATGVALGAELGEQEFLLEAGGVSYIFAGRTILRPTLRSNGLEDAAAFRARRLAPGSYMTIRGVGLSEVTRVFATSYLPLSLSNVSVSFDSPAQRISSAGRLHFVGGTQINVQIPWELTGLTTAQMKVSIGDISSALVEVPLAEFTPGIFEFTDPDTGRLTAAARDEAFALVSSTNSVERGRIVQLYANGLGRVTNQPPTGEPASGSPLSETLTRPEVAIGGRPAEVQFSGLSPGSVGLYQVNVRVPLDLAPGAHPVILSIGGETSQTSSLPVR